MINIKSIHNPKSSLVKFTKRTWITTQSFSFLTERSNLILNKNAPFQARLQTPLSFQVFFPRLHRNMLHMLNKTQLGIPMEQFFQQLDDFMEDYEEEIVHHVPEWEILRKYNYKRNCYHIISVFFTFHWAFFKSPVSCYGTEMEQITDVLKRSKYDPEFEKFLTLKWSLRPDEKNLLYWVILLHDINKRGLPLLLSEKDFFHPFLSAERAINILLRLAGFERIKDLNFHAEVNELCEMIKEAKLIQEVSYFSMARKEQVTHELEVPDVSKLPAINHKIDRIFKKGQFLNDAIKLVLLHQSLPSLKKFDILEQKIELQDLNLYFDARLLKLMEIFMIYDSESYLVNTNRSVIQNRLEFFKTYQKLDKVIKPEKKKVTEPGAPKKEKTSIVL